MSNKDQQFESLVKSFYQPLFCYAFWICKNHAVAEDLVQETFTRAWKSLHQLKDIKAAKSWLFTILSRENARRFERKQLPVSELNDDWQLEQISDNNQAINQMLLRRDIFKLDDHFRIPLALQIIGGFSTDEIAEALNTNANTISTRLFRARAQLKKQLTDSSTSQGENHG
ncbi:sigma-70 family RNA polymerase sigma factor [Aliikangiella maris]|uniref:Sigma-70 family RNA polymerase sigma factor n=2 Tax=Aliikangiella maris TaxID=3162458 RepID=A0ABV2BYM6_9GAMM